MKRLAVALFLIGPMPAQSATILARCGPSVGQSYYFEGGVIGPGHGGWKPDGYENGRITAYINDKNEVDILLKDATGLKSYLSQGYKVEVVAVQESERALLINASGPNFTESYLFKTNKLGVGTLAWTASKTADLLIRTSVMVAECGPKFAIAP